MISASFTVAPYQGQPECYGQCHEGLGTVGPACPCGPFGPSQSQTLVIEHIVQIFTRWSLELISNVLKKNMTHT